MFMPQAFVKEGVPFIYVDDVRGSGLETDRWFRVHVGKTAVHFARLQGSITRV